MQQQKYLNQAVLLQSNLKLMDKDKLKEEVDEINGFCLPQDSTYQPIAYNDEGIKSFFLWRQLLKYVQNKEEASAITRIITIMECKKEIYKFIETLEKDK